MTPDRRADDTDAGHQPTAPVTVLRLGHRRQRDARITTHVALTARAFGADAFVLGSDDAGLLASIEGVVRRFGGPFDVKAEPRWRPVIAGFQGYKVHLTMYGERFSAGLGKVPRHRPVLLVVGAEKVPRDVYEMVDLNLAVGNQPHSEVAAVAATLLALKGPEALDRPFAGARLLVRPHPRGKDVAGSDECPAP